MSKGKVKMGRSKRKGVKKHCRRKFVVLIVILAAICVLAFGSFRYMHDYYHAEDATAALEDTDDVSVLETASGYMYDGPGKDTALIFYPGAKVEDIAYAPLLKQLAASGIDCFLVKMPCNLAIFGKDRAEDVLDEFGDDYKNWYLAGHSLGGAMAAEYASQNADCLQGLIFLASYSTKDLSDTQLKVLSLYGSEDQVLNKDKVVQGRELMPETYVEHEIVGGNHAQFGDYGVQKGDGTATISAEEQQQETVQQILTFIQP